VTTVCFCETLYAEMSTTADGMRGKRVILTGASRGIGRATALALGRDGAHLSFVVRDAERGEAVAEEVRSLGGGGEIEVFVADLSSMASVRRVGEEILAKHGRIDVLVNNAGVLLMDRQITKDGHEATFATNHLAYFLLTKVLLGAIKKAPAGRIVNVASEAHRRGSLVFDDLMGEKRFRGMHAYSTSKLANILFTSELARHIEGTTVTTNALHPGVIASGFAHNNGGFVGFLAKVAAPFLMSSENGAKTTVFLATNPSVSAVSGKYFDKCEPRTPSREARDPSVAKRLWDVSEELVSRIA
jgi:NAD(P)-dependent dehydrogenase (short-subunit alcohol dehydrogenase family)